MRAKTLWGWITVLLVSLVLIQGCATRQRTGQAAGAAVGTAVGAAVGEDAEGALLGGVVGALAGSEIGRYLDQRDRRYIGTALEEEPSGETTTWTNPDTGRRYSVTPQEPYGDDPCREFTFSSGPVDEEHVACRQPDGTWAIRS